MTKTLGGVESVWGILVLTVKYWYALSEYVFMHKTYDAPTTFKGDTWAKVQVYSLSLIFKLWSKPHYRSPSFQQDMLDNLKNVAIPGTGLALSYFCYSWWTCGLFVFFANPTICMLGALNKAMKEQPPTEAFSISTFLQSTYRFYASHLLHPDDWFSLWRLNCRLASYHSLVTGAKGYNQEDKWTFLTEGKAMGVPVSPFIDDMPAMVMKHKSIEGGMGIHFFKNAAAGGDWILQEQLTNADWLSDLLPANSPLSTMRVITTSTWSLCHHTEVDRRTGKIRVDPSPTEGDFFGVSELKRRMEGTAQGVGECLRRAPYNLGGWTVAGGGGVLVPEGAAAAATAAATGAGAGAGAGAAATHNTTDQAKWASTGAGKSTVSASLAEAGRYVKAVSAVLRLGRSGALTDHSSVLFDVGVAGVGGVGAVGVSGSNQTATTTATATPTATPTATATTPTTATSTATATATTPTATDSRTTHHLSTNPTNPTSPIGQIKRGMTNAHWYKLGPHHTGRSSWLPEVGFECHPDEPQPLVTGKVIPGMQMAIDIVVASHYKLMRDVPIVGWDVTFTPHGIYLLEVNLSCNFFRGSFDVPEYVSFVDAYWGHIEELEQAKKAK